jgi:hypothetical protein
MKGENAPIVVMQAGMEICWRYAWASFLIAAVLDRPFPLPGAIVSFAAGALLTFFSRGRGWRVFQILALQAMGLIGSTGLMVYTLVDSPFPWWDWHWIADLFTRPDDFVQGLILAMVIFLSAFFFVGGILLAGRSSSSLGISIRFDCGIAYFLALLLFKWVLLSKGGIEPGGVRPELLLFPFFIFSLLSIGLARNRGSGPKDFLSGSPHLGLLLTILMIVVLFATGLFLLFLPYLTAAAQAGYGALQMAAEPMGPFLLRILRFLLLGRGSRQDPQFGDPGGSGSVEAIYSEPGWWEQPLHGIVKWGFGGLFVAFLLAVGFLGCWHLFRWLFSREGKGQDREKRGLFHWLKGLWQALFSWLSRRMSHRQGIPGATRIFRSLRTWGVRSGIPPRANQTPREYGFRLKKRFPSLAEEIETIITLYHHEVYGGRMIEASFLAPGRLALRRLRSPRFWPARVQSWFFPQETEGDPPRGRVHLPPLPHVPLSDS